MLLITELFAQNIIIDSLEAEIRLSEEKDVLKLQNALARLYIHKDPYKAIEYAKKTLSQIDDKDNYSVKYEAYEIIGLIYDDLGELVFALNYYTKANTIAQKYNEPLDIAKTFLDMGVINKKLSKHKEALSLLNKALHIRGDLSNDAQTALINNNIGLVYTNISYYEKALDYYYKALIIYEEIDDKSGISIEYNNIGMIYSYLNDYEKALTHYKKSLEIKISNNDTASSANSYNNIGICYKNLGQHNKALNYFNDALVIRKRYNNRKGMAVVYNNIANIYELHQQYDSSLFFHKKSLEIKESINDNYGMTISLSNLGNIYNKKNQLELAKNYLDKALVLAQIINSKNTEQYIYQYLSENSLLRGDLKNAYQYQTKYYQLKKTIISKSNKKKVEELHIIYETDIIQKELNRLQEEQLKQHQNLHVKTQIKAILIIIIGLVVALFLILIYVYFVYRKLNKKLIIDKQVSNSLIGVFDDIIALLDDEGNVLLSNYKFAVLFGYDIRSILGKNIFDIINYDLNGKRKEQFTKIIKSGESYQYEELINNQLFDVNICVVKNSISSLQRVALFAKDITNSRKVQKEIVRNNKILRQSENKLKNLNYTKDKLFSIVAHDLKNPLNTIVGFSDILVNNYDDFSENKIINFSKIMYNSAEQLYNLLENLLQWTNSQTNIENVNLEAVNLRSLVSETYNLLRLCAHKKGIIIENKIPKTLIVKADRNMISTVIRNLCQNAIKFTGKNGKITVSSKNYNTMVKISIIDTGVGISKKNIDKLFQMKENFTTHGTDNEKGTGLGLIICKEFVEKNKGIIWVESEEGYGSIFNFTIPIYES